VGYRVVGALDMNSLQAGTPDQLLLGRVLSQLGDSALNGFKVLAHGLGIDPQHLHFIGFAYRVRYDRMQS
jgi:hypothetical protein